MENSEIVEQVKKNLLPQQYVSKLTSFFKAVGDDNRVRIIYALSVKEMCVNDISAVLDISQSLVSHQLRLLKLEGFVKARRDGKNIYYSLDDQHIVDIFDVALKHIKHKSEEV